MNDEKSCTRQTRRRHRSEYRSRSDASLVRYQATSASASTRTSWTARFSPFAPVAGTMCAASPARNSRPYCIGSTTKLRIGAMPFSRTGPSVSVQPSSVARRVRSSSQIRSSGHSVDVLVGIDLEVEAADLGERRLCSANPRSW